MNAAIYFIYWQGGGGCFFLFPLVIINQELLVEHTTKLSFGCHSPMAYLYTISVMDIKKKKNKATTTIQSALVYRTVTGYPGNTMKLYLYQDH